MKIKIIYILISFLLPLQLWSTSILTEADNAYQKGNYSKASKLYESYLKDLKPTEKSYPTIELSDCYYNLGNSYYRSKNWGKAVLNYLRAIRINPQNKDAEFNLELTRSKLNDQFSIPSEMFFLSWTKSLIQSRNYIQWGHWAFSFLIIAFFFLLLYFICNKIKLRKIGFLGGTICISLLCLFHIFAFIQNQKFENESLAVVLDDISTYETPSKTAKKMQTLHEGTTLIIKEQINEGPESEIWYNIILPDGTEAWTKNESIEHVEK